MCLRVFLRPWSRDRPAASAVLAALCVPQLGLEDGRSGPVSPAPAALCQQLTRLLAAADSSSCGCQHDAPAGFVPSTAVECKQSGLVGSAEAAFKNSKNSIYDMLQMINQVCVCLCHY